MAPSLGLAVPRTPGTGALADDSAETMTEVTWIRKAAFRCDLSE
jgi:hypothetical protein